MWSFPIGKVLGIPIKVHALLPIFWIIQVVIAAVDAPENRQLQAAGFAALVYGPIIFLSVLIHEFGHSLAARSVGGTADHILLWPLGGLAYCGHDGGPKADLWVTFAGPLTHVPQATIWLLISFLTWKGVSGDWGLHLDNIDYNGKSGWFGHSLVVTSFWLNITIMLFNLFIPAYPLDGGRILVDFLLICGVPPTTAAWIAIAAAGIIAIAIIVMGVLRLAFGVMGILIGLFILASTYQLWKTLNAGQLEHHPLFKVGKPEAHATSMATYKPDNAGPPRPAAQV